MKKRGSFFTLGITFFALVVLSLAIIASSNLASYDTRFSEAVTLHRLYDLDSSTQEAVRIIFQQESGIDIALTQNSTSFSQSLPLNNRDFSVKLKSFGDFVENNENFVKLNFTVTNESTPLIVKPWGIMYKQSYSSNAVEVLNTLRATSYSFTVSFTQENLTSCSSSLVAGSVPLSFTATGTNGTQCLYSQDIDPSGDSTIDVNSVELRINNGFINISTSANVTVSTRLSLPDAGLNMSEAWIHSNVTNITFIDVGRVGGVKLV